MASGFCWRAMQQCRHSWRLLLKILLLYSDYKCLLVEWHYTVVVAAPLLPSQVVYLLLARTQQNGTNDATNCYPRAPPMAGGDGKWAWRHADCISSTLISCLAITIAHTHSLPSTQRNIY